MVDVRDIGSGTARATREMFSADWAVRALATLRAYGVAYR